MKKLLPPSVGLFLVLTGPGCSTPPWPHTLAYYFYYDPRSPDPALSTDVPTGGVVALLFDNLTQFDATLQLAPDSASSSC